MKKNGFTLVQIALVLVVIGLALGAIQLVNEKTRELEMKAEGGDPKKTYISERRHVYIDHETGCEYLSLTIGGTLVPRLGSDGRPLCRKKEWFK